MKASFSRLFPCALAAVFVLSCAGSRQNRTTAQLPSWWETTSLENTHSISAFGRAVSTNDSLALFEARRHALASIRPRIEMLIARASNSLAQELGTTQDSEWVAKFRILSKAGLDSVIQKHGQVENQDLQRQPDGLCAAYISVSIPLEILQSALAEIKRALNEEEKYRSRQRIEQRANIELERLSEDLFDSTRSARDMGKLATAKAVTKSRPIVQDSISHREDNMRRLARLQTSAEDIINPLAEDGTAISNSTQNLFERFEAIKARLPFSKFSFAAPETMRVNASGQVVLLASAGMTLEALKDSLQREIGSGVNLMSDSVKSTPVMEAVLHGDGFDVKQITTEVQPIGYRSYTRWEWIVKANVLGKRILRLQLNVVFGEGDNEKRYTIKTYRKEVFVRNASNAVADWLDDNFTMILIAIISAILSGYFAAYFTHRYTNSSPKKDDPDPTAAP